LVPGAVFTEVDGYIIRIKESLKRENKMDSERKCTRLIWWNQVFPKETEEKRGGKFTK